MSMTNSDSKKQFDKLSSNNTVNVTNKHVHLNHSSKSSIVMTQNRDLYKEVTQKVISLLQNGEIPWKKTFGSSYGVAKNYESQKPYRGFNFFYLNFIASNVYDLPYYLTFNQVKKLGGKVKKGSLAERVYFYDYFFKNEGTNKTFKKEEVSESQAKSLKKIHFLKYFPVFNVSQIEGIEFDIKKREPLNNSPIERCEALINFIDPEPNIKHENANRAYFDPMEDYINIPSIEMFDTSDAYYATMFHELGHWSGAETRLSRKGIVDMKSNVFGDKEYSEEELIAEMTSAYLNAFCGIDTEALTSNNAAYIQSWLRAFEEKPRMLIHASNKAFEAAQYLTGGELFELNAKG